ncbi:hypothetical protein GCM10028796_17370 [Ramlibacter monticola]|uniref:Uncharacterized protein n=1 Tax=Ramlibacter monticola TaxID=1926872 RepID=A0A936YVQ6_9BURK|nr:hypothetical protein [Ramlibacter monticola]MBL0390563.1 hypothetical protein [Ramlibacter monticola]
MNTKPGKLEIGPLTYGRAGKHYKLPQQEFQQPSRVTNANAKGTYSQQNDWAGSALRTGCLDFLKCPSRGGGLMRTAVAETSLEAFHSLPVADYLAPKEAAVLALFTGPEVRLSRQQIAQIAPMPINCVCGRVDSLLAGGHLEEAGTRKDPHTGKSQKLLQLPRSAQGELLGGAA